MSKEELQSWLTEIIKGLVLNPEAVQIEQTTDDRGVLFTLHIDQADAGKIIGRKGETVHSIRNLLRIAAYNNNVHASLKVDIPDRRDVDTGDDSILGD